mmetsp:Transcript_11923/g.18950  ORF Transcript_11923/g.18950 Transcript_11923/m.18950 type:complete len:165 (-) Transcript_11923:200-694(-)
MAARILGITVLGTAAALQFTGHAQATYQDDYGHENIVVFGGYDIIDKFLHYDINDQVDGLYTKHLEFNNEVYRLNLSRPFDSWQKIEVMKGTDGRPSGRVLHSMSMSADQKSFIIFGGTQCFRKANLLFGYALQDVWRFYITNQTWVNVVPQGKHPDSFDSCNR